MLFLNANSVSKLSRLEALVWQVSEDAKQTVTLHL